MGGGRACGRWWLWLAMSALCALVPGVLAPSVPKDATADIVNVISVENMDALLRLSLGPDLLPLNRSVEQGADGGSRTRRATAALCGRPACRCDPAAGNKWLNVSCAFSKQEVVELGPGSVPYNLLELRIDNLAELVVESKTFSNTTALNRVIVSRVGRLHIHTGAFTNISSASLFLQIEECKDVRLDDHSFRSMRGPVSATFTSCEHFAMGSSVFSWLLRFSIINVPTLALVENTFSVESVKTPRHGHAATIIFQNVTLDVIPNGTFSSSAGEIIFRDCRIRVISRGAFNAIQFSRVVFDDSELELLENGAFSDRTQVFELELLAMRISLVEPGVLTAVTNLTVHNCRIGELREGAFNITAARIHLTDNFFTTVRRRAFEVYSWNDVLIDSNVFEHLDPDAFSLPFYKIPKMDNYVFAFTANQLIRVDVSGLAFLPRESEVDVRLWGNRFQEPCSCRLQAWTADIVGATTLAERLYKTSLCSVTDWLALCFRLTAGAMPMVNYTEQICGPGSELLCEEPSRRFYPADPNLDWTLLLDNEKRVLTIIFITVLTCVSFILIIVAAKWVQRKGLIGRIISQFFQSSSLVTTSSISRVNIHEYAEIQNLRNQTQVVEESDEEEMVAVDDKATQTLPEELTQDLLQSLREKLDDPENYREARDMIEHLYDLIKVEESCNNRTSVLVEDTLYAELQPRTRPRPRNREVVSVGTRSPSLDRLAPVHYLPRAAVANDYSEPRDRQVSSHVYCELPGDVPGGVPDVLVSSRLLANRPLPEAPGSSQA